MLGAQRLGLLIEGIAGTNGQFLIAVHWHPEELAGNDAAMRRLFSAFINASSQWFVENGQ